jgi:DNA-binding XRE family transcriptional regulator
MSTASEAEALALQLRLLDRTVIMANAGGIANRVTKARLEAGFKSQSALARALGVKPQTIQSIESGRSRNSRLMPMIAARTGFEFLWLMTGEGPERSLNKLAQSLPAYDDPSPDALKIARAYMKLRPPHARLILALVMQLAKDAGAMQLL